MCGIWAWIRPFKSVIGTKTNQELWDTGVKGIGARGPEGHRWLDISGERTAPSKWCFSRLAINGLNEGAMQPFTWNSNWAWMCNGEIYNSKALEEETGYLSATGSDCEVLGAVWEHVGGNPMRFARALDGVFALVLHYKNALGGRYVVARDPYGVRPLFYTKFDDDSYLFASERKAIEPFLNGRDETICEFPPGEIWTFYGDAVKKEVYHDIPWLKLPALGTETLRGALDAAVEKRLMTERPVAALLSGGVDSSLIASLVQSKLKALGKPALKTFSIGMAGGTDLKYAKMVAEHIGSDHTEVIVTADEMFDAIPAVIRDTETYDITTVRASVGNWLVAKAIREKTDCKVVFNGDGSDEVFGSYLYFYRAPSDFEFEEEVRRLLREIHQYDVLRSDRSISSHGLEARTPFLDRQFVMAALAYSSEQRRPCASRMDRIEKQLLRNTFADSRLLPNEVLYRRKEAFSDGVSAQEKSWFEIIQEKIKDRKLVPEDWREIAYKKNWWPAPPTEEAFYYRQQFEELYPHTGKLWPYWMPRWSPETSDPSARTLSLPMADKP